MTTTYKFQTAAIIGAGAWGTTLARHLAERGLDVTLWAYEAEVVKTIRDRRENAMYLPGVALPSFAVTDSMADAVRRADAIVFAVPSHAARAVLVQLAAALPKPLPVISATKGIEEGTLKLVSQIMDEVLPPDVRLLQTVLSGPSFAAEVCAGRPTAVVLAGQDGGLVSALQQRLLSSLFRVYAGRDLIGVQVGGALKNVMAVAAGIVDGLALGHNARAALITRGLAEMVRLGVAMGAQPQTFYGLSGAGDLVLTCTGPLSRNYTVGVKLGRGEALPAILGGTHAVAEGVRTSRAAADLATRHGIEMPIVREVCHVVFEGKAPQRAVADLMERAAKDEHESWTSGA
jgi:glycerol-3-phosphate dehydrogenase (NAD(P)+)